MVYSYHIKPVTIAVKKSLIILAPGTLTQVIKHIQIHLRSSSVIYKKI
jgi:hypothetical protein